MADARPAVVGDASAGDAATAWPGAPPNSVVRFAPPAVFAPHETPVPTKRPLHAVERSPTYYYPPALATRSYPPRKRRNVLGPHQYPAVALGHPLAPPTYPGISEDPRTRTALNAQGMVQPSLMPQPDLPRWQVEHRDVQCYRQPQRGYPRAPRLGGGIDLSQWQPVPASCAPVPPLTHHPLIAAPTVPTPPWAQNTPWGVQPPSTTLGTPPRGYAPPALFFSSATGQPALAAPTQAAAPTSTASNHSPLVSTSSLSSPNLDFYGYHHHEDDSVSSDIMLQAFRDDDDDLDDVDDSLLAFVN